MNAVTEVAEPLVLEIQGRGEGVAWACGACVRVHSPMIYAASKERAWAEAERAARECCAPNKCRVCGCEVERSWLECAPCRHAAAVQREKERFAAARRVDASEAGAMLWDEEHERWLHDSDDAEDSEPAVRYAYATRAKRMHIDATEIVENALESGEHHEDAWREIGPAETNELQAMLDAWCKRVDIVSHFPDYSRVVVFDAALRGQMETQTMDGR